MGKTSDKIEVFFKSMKWKRISSLLDGFCSGFLLGMVISLLLAAYWLEVPMPANVVTAILIAVIFAVAMFVWGVHSALATKET